MAGASASNARFVRCPKCKNLLPGLPGISVFQCGGCGAVLRAERIHVNPVDNYAKEMVGAVYPKSNVSLHNGENDFSGASDLDVKLNGGSSVAEFDDAVADQDIYRTLPLPAERILNFSRVVNNPRLESQFDPEPDRMGVSFFENSNFHLGNVNGYTRLEPNRQRERVEMENYEKRLKSIIDGLMLPSLNGPVEYNSEHTIHVGAGMRNKYIEGSERVARLEHDRFELLRKLEELNIQLSQSKSLPETLIEKAISGGDLANTEPYGVADSWMSDDCSDMSKAIKQTPVDNKNLGRLPYYANPGSYANRHGQCMESSYHHSHIQKDAQRYEVGFEPQMPRRPATLTSIQYYCRTKFPIYHPGQYIDAEPDAFEPYKHNFSSHHPGCSCFHCYNKHHNMIPHISSSNFHDNRFVDLPSNPGYYHHDRSNSLVPGDYDSRITRGPSSLHSPTTRTKVILSKRGRHCYPLDGGAPFMTCPSCFELLQLPFKLLKLKHRQQKFYCGACSTLIYYFFQQTKLVFSEHSELKNDSDSSEMMDGGISKFIGPSGRTDAEFKFDGSDIFGSDSNLLNDEPALPAPYRNLNTDKTNDTNSIATTSVSPSSTDEKCSQINLKAQRKMHGSIDSTRPPPGSPLQEHFDHSSNNHAVYKHGKGNQSEQPDKEELMPKGITSYQNSLKDISMATETDVSINEYLNSCISQDSGAGGKEVQHPQINGKDGFASTLKKSFKDISKHNQGVGDENSVTINGYLIADHIIKKAAKRAGRIRPGNYWYDIRAGFWGVMGGPCLGMIPPFIEELNYPLSENCSGGTTGVFVNGRELHEKDLELLSSRGLPTIRDRSYIIEISGRVLEEGSGKELDSLGRLARTVEKAKRGFGMKVPKQIDVSKIEQ